jgi:hypothetical protein
MKMKITTEDCVVEINKHKQGSWKRTSKKSKRGIIVRTFTAKEFPNIEATVEENKGRLTVSLIGTILPKTEIPNTIEELLHEGNTGNGIIFRKAGNFVEDGFDHINFIPRTDYKTLVKKNGESAPQKEKVKAGTKILLVASTDGFVYHEIEIKKDTILRWYDGWCIFDAGDSEVLKIEDDPADMDLDEEGTYDFDLKVVKAKHNAQRIFTTL